MFVWVARFARSVRRGRGGSAILLPRSKELISLRFSLPSFGCASVDVALSLGHGRGDEFPHGGPALDPRERQAKRPTARDITIPAFPVSAIKVTTRDFR